MNCETEMSENWLKIIVLIFIELDKLANNYILGITYIQVGGADEILKIVTAETLENGLLRPKFISLWAVKLVKFIVIQAWEPLIKNTIFMFS